MTLALRVLLLPALACAALCQAPPAAAPPKPALLWKVTAGERSAYLFGSIHFGSPSLYPLPGAVEDAFAAANVLMVEVDLNRLDLQKTAMAMLSRAMYAPDDSLWKHVSAATRAKVERFCEQNGLPAGMAARMRPWMLAMTASALPYSRLGLDPALGLDKHFLDRAGSRRVEQLESAEWQIELFAGLPEAAQEKLLEAVVGSGEDTKAMADALVAAWSAGDAVRLDELTAKTSREPAEIGRRLRQDRHPHMADAIEGCLKRGDRCFLVVGAAHLVGEGSVVGLLEKRGYQVEQVGAAASQPMRPMRPVQ